MSQLCQCTAQVQEGQNGIAKEVAAAYKTIFEKVAVLSLSIHTATSVCFRLKFYQPWVYDGWHISSPTTCDRSSHYHSCAVITLLAALSPVVTFPKYK